jgi:hypothetical protein
MESIKLMERQNKVFVKIVRWVSGYPITMARLIVIVVNARFAQLAGFLGLRKEIPQHTSMPTTGLKMIDSTNLQEKPSTQYSKESIIISVTLPTRAIIQSTNSKMVTIVVVHFVQPLTQTMNQGVPDVNHAKQAQHLLGMMMGKV